MGIDRSVEAEFSRCASIYQLSSEYVLWRKLSRKKQMLSIGFSASYVCPSSKLFTLDADDQHYGFEAFTALLQGVEDALNSDISARALLYTKGLVV